MQREHREPELVVALENQHDPIALFYTDRLEVVRGLCGISLHVLKRKSALVLVMRKVQHSELVRLLLRDLVHDIERKVKFILVYKFYTL